MIRVQSIELNPGKMEADVFLMADTKSEVTDGATIEGFPQGYKISFGSKCMTTSKELAFMGSDGEWNWGD